MRSAIMGRMLSNDPNVTYFYIFESGALQYHGGMVDLSEMLRINTYVTRISLFGERLTLNDLILLTEALKNNSTLKVLDISNNRFDAEVVDILVDLLTNYNNTLTNLNIHGCRMGWRCSKLISCPYLINLDLSFDDLGSVGGKQVAIELVTNTTLKELILKSDSINADTVIELAEVLTTKNSTLEILDLSGNYDIGVRGAKYLADMLKVNISLTELRISSNSIADEGSKSISEALIVNNSLKTLSVSSNDIGTEGVRAFADALRKNTSLTSFNIMGVDGSDVSIIVDALKDNPYLIDFGSLETSGRVIFQDKLRIWNKLKLNAHNAKMKEDSFFYLMSQSVGDLW